MCKSIEELSKMKFIPRDNSIIYYSCNWAFVASLFVLVTFGLFAEKLYIYKVHPWYSLLGAVVLGGLVGGFLGYIRGFFGERGGNSKLISYLIVLIVFFVYPITEVIRNFSQPGLYTDILFYIIPGIILLFGYIEAARIFPALPSFPAMFMLGIGFVLVMIPGAVVKDIFGNYIGTIFSVIFLLGILAYMFRRHMKSTRR